MKKENKNLVIGVLLGIILSLTLGAKTYQTIHRFRIVKDNQNRAVVVDRETAIARYIRLDVTNPPSTRTLLLSDNWTE